jgi:inner membrane protein
VGLPVEAAIVVAGVYGLHRWRVSRHSRHPTARPLTHAPIRWGMLYSFCLLALLSHLFLDYTNNYGLRPFFPFNPHWYAGSFVFIFDPILFALLLLPVVLPALFALVSSEVGARKPVFRGRGLACTAALLIVCYWGLRVYEHQQAVALAQAVSVAEPVAAPDISTVALDSDALLPTPPTPVYVQPRKVLANPDPLNPWHWYVDMDFGAFVQLGEANTRRGELTRAQEFFTKPMNSPAILAAEASPLGRAYMDWSPMPLMTVARGTEAQQNAAAPATTTAIVDFRDPRFMAGIPRWGATGQLPLSGEVFLDTQQHVLQQIFDGRLQR